MLTCRIQIEFGRRTITVCAEQNEGTVTTPLTVRDSIAKRYRGFAKYEVKGRSPLYEMLASRVVDDEATLDFLARLPEIKQQPNLLFGAIKYLFGAAQDWRQFQALIAEHGE